MSPQNAPVEKKASWLDKPFFSSISFNWETLIFLLILAAAAVTRFYDLEARVMSHDESLHTYFSWVLYKGNGFAHTPLMHGPLQFHLIAFTYWLFGDNDFTARIPVVVFSIASVGFVWWGFRRYLGRIGALAAALLFVISPFMLYYGRYVRNESYVVLFGLLTLWAALRYLDTGDLRYTYWVTLATVLHFAAKETSFIYTAQLMFFLGLLFLYQVNRRRWQKIPDRRIFMTLLTIALVLGLAAGSYGLLSRNMGTLSGTEVAAPAEPTEDGEAPAEPVNPVVLGLFLGALGAGAISLYFLGRGYGLERLRQMRSFGLLLLLTTLVLPHLAAFPVRAAGWNPMDYTSVASMLRIAAFLIPLGLIATALGLWWNPRVWLVNVAIFYGIFTVFYTTMFTNGQGFFTGLVGSLGYWLEQQGVKRGNQPWYYYILVQIPIYEYLAFLGSAVAGALGLRWYLRRRRSLEFPDEPDVDHGLTEGQSRVIALLLLGFWTVTSYAAYTIAGEKMPWLSVHIALPMLLLTGWVIGLLAERVDWRGFASRRGWLLFLLLALFFISLSGMVAAWFRPVRPFSGQDLQGLQSTSGFLFALITAGLSGWGVTRMLGEWEQQQLLSVLGLAFFALLAVLTARTAFIATYVNYDRATEYLVYAHAARGVKDVMERVEDISLRTTDGLALVVAYDDDVSWPFTWYLRNYTNQRYFHDAPTRDLRNAPVIIVGDNNWGKIEPIVANGYYMFEYIRMWWPNQDYFNLSWPVVRDSFLRPDLRAGIAQVWLNRDFKDYSEAVGRDLSLPQWSPADRMRLYVRKDVAAALWDYGVVGGPTAETLIVDPYEGRQTAISPDGFLAADEAGNALFNGPRGVAVAPDGSLYVADSLNHRVLHIVDGRVANVIGGFGALDSSGAAPEGLFNEPWGVAVSLDGSLLFVADTWNHRVQVFTSGGRFVRAWGYFDQTDDPYAFWGPRGLAVDADGNLLVANTGNKRITIFTPEGLFVAQFGEIGFGPGQFDEPVGVAVGPDGTVYVADTWNQRIQAFRKAETGEYLPVNLWDITGWFGQALYNKPFMTVGDDGNLYVTDPDLSRILVFTADGDILRYWGDADSGAEIIGQPIGVASDGRGGLWVVDGEGNRLLHYTLP
ncbi:MAG: TIGR03663 family protein [Chloroflexi bacterium]|nr:TIGR03663 family protein [Chloroflexota bacterium]